MLLAILATNMTLQKHNPILPVILNPEKRLGRYTGHLRPIAYITSSKSVAKNFLIPLFG
jgi:hypothetical protein